MVEHLVEFTWISKPGVFPRQWHRKLQRVYSERGEEEQHLKDIRRSFYQGEAMGDMPHIRFFDYADGIAPFEYTWNELDIDTWDYTGAYITTHEKEIGPITSEGVALPSWWHGYAQNWPKAWNECD